MSCKFGFHFMNSDPKSMPGDGTRRQNRVHLHDSSNIKGADVGILWSYIELVELMFYFHGHVGRSFILTTLLLGKPPRGSLPVHSAASFAIN